MDQDRPGEFYCKGFFSPLPPSPPLPRTPGPDWERPGELTWADEVLADAYRRSRGAFCRREGDGFLLAYPLDCRCPFPLPALFCFARASFLGGRGWWVFSFDNHGLPRFGDV